MASPPTITLLTLPREIRNEIYAHCFNSQQHLISLTGHESDWFDPGVFAINHQMRNEVNEAKERFMTSTEVTIIVHVTDLKPHSCDEERYNTSTHRLSKGHRFRKVGIDVRLNKSRFRTCLHLTFSMLRDLLTQIGPIEGVGRVRISSPYQRLFTAEAVATSNGERLSPKPVSDYFDPSEGPDADPTCSARHDYVCCIVFRLYWDVFEKFETDERVWRIVECPVKGYLEFVPMVRDKSIEWGAEVDGVACFQ